MPFTYDSAMARAQIALIKQTPDAEQRFELLRCVLPRACCIRPASRTSGVGIYWN